MVPQLRNLLSLIQLTRIALALAVVSNCWMTVFLAKYIEPASGRTAILGEMPLGVALFWATIVAIGLHIHGVAMNDVLDAKHDRLFSPQRPIPAGRVNRKSAVIIAIIGLLSAMVAAAFLGHEAIMLAALAATVLLFFNSTGKFLPAAGILTLVLLRMITMLIPNSHLGFAWPLWMTMTHVAAATALGYLLEDKRPHLDQREIVRLAIGWVIGTTAIVSFMLWRGTILAYGRPFIWIGPAIAGAIFFAVSWAVVVRANRLNSTPKQDHAMRRNLGRSYVRLSILWLIVYDAAWLFSAELIVPGLIHLMLFISVYAILYVMRPIQVAMGERPTYLLGARQAESE